MAGSIQGFACKGRTTYPGGRVPVVDRGRQKCTLDLTDPVLA